MNKKVANKELSDIKNELERMENKKFKRIADEGWLGMGGGVCAGIAYYFEIPIWLVRMISFLLILYTGVGLLVYILLWMFVPVWDKTPSDYKQLTE